MPLAWVPFFPYGPGFSPALCAGIQSAHKAMMGAGALIKKIWQHPLAKGVCVNGSHAIEIHHRILRSKPLLYGNYLRWYRECLPAFHETKNLPGQVIEIGSGAGFLEEMIPGLIKTDVVPNPYASRVVDAMQLDFGDKTLRCIFLIGVLHHVLFPAKFLHEAERCLVPGGRLVMVEPNNNFLQRFLTRYLDHYEYVDDTIKDWVNGATGRMDHANLALPWVIFVRDRARFEKEFPLLKIKPIRYHTFLSYAVTGGMTYRSFLPAFMAPLVEGIENLAAPFMQKLGTGMTIDLVKGN